MGKLLGRGIIIVVVLAIIVPLLVDGGSSSPARRNVRQAGPTALSTAVEKLLADGSIHSVDVNGNMARIDPMIWGALSIEQKRIVVMMLSGYFNDKRGYKRVTIRSNRNDTELATYSVFSGCTIHH